MNRAPLAALALVFAATALVPVAGAQTFDEALFEQLENNCQVLRDGQIPEGNLEILKIGPNLASVCGFQCTTNGMGGLACVLSAGNDGGTGGTASQRTSTRPALKRLLSPDEEREDEEKVALHLNSSTGFGASRILELTQGIDFFFTLEYERRDKEASRFEDGYESHIADLLIGLDHQIDDQRTVGGAFNYAYFGGDFDEGGDFDTHSYGLIAYGSVNPTPEIFTNGVLRYAHKRFERTREPFFSRTLGVGPDVPVLEFGGPVDADFRGNEFGMALSGGWDFPHGAVTLGPRASLDFVLTHREGFEETGGTGLELRFRDDERLSLQGRLGGEATLAVSTAIGVLVHQFGMNWVHEYLDDQRKITARFAEDDRSSPIRFRWETEKPDRDFAEVMVSASLMLRGGFSIFASFRTFMEHDQFDVYSGAIGMRLAR